MARELQVEVMELDESGYPQPTGRFETLAADTVILALGQETRERVHARAAGRRSSSGTARSRSTTTLMTGCPGVFAGGDMVPSERTVTIGVGHGKKAARHIDAWLRDATVASAPKHPLATFDSLHLWFFGDAARRQQPELGAGGARRRTSTRCSAACRRDAGGLRGGALPVVRQLLRVRRLPRRLPGGRGHQARASATAIASTTTAAPAARRASSSARCTPSRCSRSRS